jgi:hypothetical protein
MNIEDKLAELRKRYVSEPHNREVIKRMARALAISEELRLKKMAPQQTHI